MPAWTTLTYFLGDDFGLLLLDDDLPYTYPTAAGPRVPAFHTAEGAALFARQKRPGPVESLGSLDLRPLEAFVLGVGPAPAYPELVDAWLLLADVAEAAGRLGEVADPDEVPAAEADPSAALAALQAGLRIFREVVAQLDAPPRRQP